MVDAAAGSLFDPEGFGAGGFLDDADCVIVEARVVNGADTPMTDAADRTFLKVTYDPDAEDQESRDEYYGLGPIEKFTPSKDNKRVVYEAGTKINKNSKSALYFAGLINAGFPKSSLPADGDVTFLEGLHVHVNVMPMPEMKGGKNQEKFKKKDGAPPTVVIVTKLLKPRAGAGAAKPKAAKVNGAAGQPTSAPAAQQQSAAASSTSDEVVAETVGAIMGIIAEKGMAMMRLLPTEIMARITDAKIRTAAFKLIGDKAWLGHADRPWSLDAGSGELRLPS